MKIKLSKEYWEETKLSGDDNSRIFLVDEEKTTDKFYYIMGRNNPINKLDCEIVDRWIFVHDMMPPISEYCMITGGYQSILVDVKTKNGNEYKATLQLYGSSLGYGWNSEWWENGCLSKDTVEDVLCWRNSDTMLIEHFGRSFDEVLNQVEYWKKLKSR